ncbi:MAG: hypothetical protein QF535_17705 [Anaerolineales bacterium]|nr:hypothetical protein [Anaerolineales bacterium]
MYSDLMPIGVLLALTAPAMTLAFTLPTCEASDPSLPAIRVYAGAYSPRTCKEAPQAEQPCLPQPAPALLARAALLLPAVLPQGQRQALLCLNGALNV